MRRRWVRLGFRRVVMVSALVGISGMLAVAQAPVNASPRFEVASVKENVSHGTSSAISTSSSDRLVITNVPLRFLVLYAYELPDHRLAGMPGWSEERSFDIQAVYPEGKRPSDEGVRVLMQNLLADRFGLKLHHEQRVLPAYDLTVARHDGQTGPQMQPVAQECLDPATGKRTGGGLSGSRGGAVPPPDREAPCSIAATRTKLWGGAVTPQQLAATIQAMVGRPVLDRTGLSGRYHIFLHWAPTQLRADGEAGGDAAEEDASIFTALREQLGLKMVSRRESFDVLVVDSVGMPGRD